MQKCQSSHSFWVWVVYLGCSVQTAKDQWFFWERLKEKQLLGNQNPTSRCSGQSNSPVVQAVYAKFSSKLSLNIAYCYNTAKALTISDKCWFTWHLQCQGERDAVTKATKRHMHKQSEGRLHHQRQEKHSDLLQIKKACLEESSLLIWEQETRRYLGGVHGPNDDRCILPCNCATLH